MQPTFRELYELLRANVPTETWWPADTDFEIIVGAILTQNTTWTSVMVAIENLRSQGLLEPECLITADIELVREWIRPSGYLNVKSGYLMNVTQWFIERGEAAHDVPTDELRAELLDLRGVGPETADSILLYVYRRPVFIMDAYAQRMLAAVGHDVPKGYEAAKRALRPHIDAADFTADEQAHFHGLIVDAGKLARKAGGWDVFYAQLLDQSS